MEFSPSKIFNLCIETSKDASFLYRTFIAKPTKEKEEKLGKLFGFVSLPHRDEKAIEFIHLIIAQIKENYYSQINGNKESDSANLNIEDALETALKKTNIDIFAYLEKEKLVLDIKNIHILAAAIREREIVFAAAGDVSAYLFHYRKNGNWKIVNIYDNLVSSKEDLNPLNFFTQTVYGQVQNTDCIFFCSTNILDYLSLEKIKNIVAQNDPPEAGKILKTILLAIEIPKLFLLSIAATQKNSFVLHPKEKDIHNFNYAAAASNDSLRKLANTQNYTQRLLNPSIQSNLKKFLSNLRLAASDYAKIFKNGTFLKILESKSNIFGKKNSRPKRIDMRKALQRIAEFLRENRVLAFTKNIFKNIFTFVFERFSRLPAKSKIMVIFSLVIVILLVQSLAKITLANKSKRELKILNELILESKKLGDAAEASIIYQDEDTARKLYAQAVQTLKKIPVKYHKLPEVSNLNNSLQEKLEALRHMIFIEEPVIVGNWGNLDPKSNIAPLLLPLGDILYSQNYTNLSLTSVNTQNRIMGVISPSVKNFEQIISGAPFRNEILLLNKNNTLFSYLPPQNSLKPVPLNISSGSEIISMKTFSNSLYILDITNNQILKYQRSPSGFQEYQNWIRDDIVDVTSAVDFAIDGYIYVLQKNGEVIRLFNGKLSSFSLKSIDPPIISPLKIYTNASTQYMYILEPMMKRIVVVSKEGDLIKQYESPLFDSLKDFAVMEQEKRIYVLNSSTVYGFALK